MQVPKDPSAIYELIKVLPEAAFLLSEGGEVLVANPPACRMLGASPQELCGKRLRDLTTHPPEKVGRYLRTCLRSGSPIPGSLAFETNDGRTVDCRCDGAVTSLEYEQEEVVVFLRCVPKRSASTTFLALNRELQILREEHRRIREDKEYLERQVRQRTAQLAEANEELEAFSYSVSHDLRAPLRHIGGFAHMLESTAAPKLDENDRHFLEAILKSTKQAGEMIDDLLSFSRMSRTQMHSTAVDMNRLVEETLKDLRFETDGRNIDWRVGELPEVRSDPDMLRLVMQNLLSNAVKYTRPRQRAVIEVATTTENDEIVFFVRDNGVGFDEAYADKLFGVFQRLHRADEFEGTGIGLANVRRIVQRHGGRAWAEGRLGSGATFYFSLPRARTVDGDELGEGPAD